LTFCRSIRGDLFGLDLNCRTDIDFHEKSENPSENAKDPGIMSTSMAHEARIGRNVKDACIALSLRTLLCLQQNIFLGVLVVGAADGAKYL
jgi:hypothetical protein